MADGIREHDHDVAICQTIHISNWWGGRFSASNANPYRKHVERPISADEAKENWQDFMMQMDYMAKNKIGLFASS